MSVVTIVVTSEARTFEWDEAKNTANIAKHGIDFALAQMIFSGFILTVTDERFDYGEIREISIGSAGGVAMLAVVHTGRDGRMRLISARPAKRKERQLYEDALRKATHS